MDRADSILIVDDDPEIRRLLVDYLARNGYAAHPARDGREMKLALERQTIDLVVLDLMLPDSDGLTLCRDLRANERTQNLPVLMLTARGEETDRIVGIEMGADDYLVKPFEPRELVARVRSILRRYQKAAPSEPGGHSAVHFAGWHFDIGRLNLVADDGREVSLSAAEAALLQTLLKRPNKILTREQLIGERELDPFDRSIDVRISRLRRKLEDDPQDPKIIKTVYGAGYLLCAAVVWE